MRRKRSVYIAYTGGTIGMRRGPEGYEPVPGFLAEWMGRMPELTDPEMPAYQVGEFVPLLDSSHMTPAHWMRIGFEVANRYDEHDGFVILHGTDTMAYSASGVSFILENLGKPVIFTGSQIPLYEVRSDGRENLITAMLLAAHHAVPEVCLFFGSRLLRGNRTVKVDTYGFAAFDSPNFPQLGLAGVDLSVDWDRVRRPPLGARLCVHEIRPARLGVLRFFPGISAEVVENSLLPPLEGLVLETYGVGNAPDDPRVLRALAAAVDRGVVIVNCTQCLRGAVDMADYAAGHGLRQCGVLSGFDMTTEAALAKLFYLRSLDLDPAEMGRRMQQDLRGELTESIREL